jgi:hypothetical protein
LAVKKTRLFSPLKVRTARSGRLPNLALAARLHDINYLEALSALIPTCGKSVINPSIKTIRIRKNGGENPFS